jgi:hypothetical protein
MGLLPLLFEKLNVSGNCLLLVLGMIYSLPKYLIMVHLMEEQEGNEDCYSLTTLLLEMQVQHLVPLGEPALFVTADSTSMRFTLTVPRRYSGSSCSPLA